MNFKPALVAAAMSLVIGGAQAATVTLTDDVDVNPALDVFSNSGDLSTDTFQFLLAPGTWSLTDVVVSFSGLTAGTVSLNGGPATNMNPFAIPGGTIYSLGFAGIVGDGVTYQTLTFNGFNSGTSSVTVTAMQTAAPVPEPETYAMMMAGLGAIGFMARRRKS